MYNWTALGPLLYCAVFQGSTNLTEKISAGKYPEYSEYQRLVGRFIPRLSAFWESAGEGRKEEGGEGGKKEL